MSTASSNKARAGQIGGLVRASRYSPTDLTAKARQGFLMRFLEAVDAATPGLPEDERQRRATALLRAHMARLAMKSVQARRTSAGGASGDE